MFISVFSSLYACRSCNFHVGVLANELGSSDVNIGTVFMRTPIMFKKGDQVSLTYGTKDGKPITKVKTIKKTEIYNGTVSTFAVSEKLGKKIKG